MEHVCTFCVSFTFLQVYAGTMYMGVQNGIDYFPIASTAWTESVKERVLCHELNNRFAQTSWSRSTLTNLEKPDVLASNQH